MGNGWSRSNRGQPTPLNSVISNRVILNGIICEVLLELSRTAISIAAIFDWIVD